MSAHAPNAHLLKLNPYTPVFGELEINGNNFLAWRQDMRKLVKARGLQQTLLTAFRKDEGSPAIGLFEDVKEAGDPPTLEPTAATPSPAASTSAPTDPRKKGSPSVWDKSRGTLAAGNPGVPGGNVNGRGRGRSASKTWTTGAGSAGTADRHAGRSLAAMKPGFTLHGALRGFACSGSANLAAFLGTNCPTNLDNNREWTLESTSSQNSSSSS
jgi:hypothetical protein